MLLIYLDIIELDESITILLYCDETINLSESHNAASPSNDNKSKASKSEINSHISDTEHKVPVNSTIKELNYNDLGKVPQNLSESAIPSAYELMLSLFFQVH